ncbi:hypothetical protein FisN_15Lu186 [Fistulifera solaris]|uniref:GRIP domain-containing protein n=1 Tax=Fistulifera solaris TaxID=1519565 RepID=A0A1Z5KB19_FISSO|nr:hypothetical protein FisN_15Lu186 [Fistulifera solaris]|eukprot:GAX23454.1 hypothetical protein FisN_15Lu186 [Fistulifera solaris]
MAEANNNNDAAVTIARLTAQLKKLNEANGKYKQLLKLAKERIEKQEQEQQATISNSNATTTDTKQVVAVCQRIQHADQIWALLEWEIVPENEHDVFLSDHPRFLEWKSFPEESALHDFIRRDTGEPLPIPPYSYSPEQSLQIQQEAQAQVAAVTEEFRKFRIQTELAMQQQRATNSEARRNHTTHPSRATSHPPPTPSTQQQQQQQQQQQIEQLQAELQLQDTQWKQAYDVLLAENKALKSTGSEALLASQWRQRYEACLKEKEELHSRLQNLQTEDRYEAKYRDLKESFKLYRKKAKEILEQQHQQQQQNEPGSLSSSSSSSSSDAKLSYLKNLLLQYFLADDDSTRRPMEGAIGMVLQFSPAETQQIEAKRAEKDSWF